MRSFDFDEGDMGEGERWSILLDVYCSANDLPDHRPKPCRHCHSEAVEPRMKKGDYRRVSELKEPEDISYGIVSWICPRVVFSQNEGGSFATSVCLDCILEKAKEVGEKIEIENKSAAQSDSPT